MATYIISYDLKAPGKNYNDLITALESYGTYWHNLGSTWCIVTNKTATEVRDHLTRYMDANDRLLVVLSGGVGAWKGFNADAATWLVDNL